MTTSTSTETRQQPLPPPIVEEVTLGSLARDALKSAGGNAEIAVKRLLYRLKSDQALLRLVLETAIKLAVTERMTHTVGDARKAIYNEHVERVHARAAASPVKPTRDNVVALADAVRRCLLDFPLAGGKKLRDASRAELLEHIDRNEKNANSLLHKARWLRLIADRVPDGKIVGQVIKEDTAQALFEEAQNAE